MEDKLIVGLLYDFDKTLSTQDMQDYAFIPGLGMEPDRFWEESGAFGARERMDGILCYMYTMVRKSRELGRPFTRETLHEGGRSIKFFPGVMDWFQRIESFGNDIGVRVEHYVISSGLREIIDGCPIAPFFKEIYASEFYYDEEGHPVWPKMAINFTAKTQFVYRINKDVLDVADDKRLNDPMPDDSRRIPFQNMIYFGDGMSDVPCMKMIKSSGGRSIAVYQEGNRPNVEKLLRQGRVDYIFPADYREGSEMESTVKLILRKMAVDHDLSARNSRQMQSLDQIEKSTRTL